MSPKEQPRLTVIAGPNGSGKSTLTRALLASVRVPILDPDAIARELLPMAPAQVQVAAGRLVLRRQRAYVVAGTSFAFETTLSGHTAVRLMAAARQRGFSIQLLYVCTENADINVGRIAERLLQGGHPVPEPDIRRRYIGSLRNLLPAIRLSDTAILFDNTGEAPELVLSINTGLVVEQAKLLPRWLTTALGAFLIEAGQVG
ncbi:MAG: AAA family ATPase [Chloroflexota bacterium]